MLSNQKYNTTKVVVITYKILLLIDTYNKVSSMKSIILFSLFLLVSIRFMLLLNDCSDYRKHYYPSEINIVAALYCVLTVTVL